ncbi:MAG: hypothetical protein CMB20_003660 [Methanobacteriota archaeon]|nr:MAG: hypothetical protein CMB20_003660 [Euryarchaeota archaeon]
MTEEESKALLDWFVGAIRTNVGDSTESEALVENTAVTKTEEDETHDCLENVEFEYFQDEDFAGHCVHCTVCGAEVTQEYEELYGPENYDFFDDWREQ